MTKYGFHNPKITEKTLLRIKEKCTQTIQTMLI
jgi:hypothetical protein